MEVEVGDNIVIYKTDRPMTLVVDTVPITFTQVEIVDGRSSNTETTLLFTNNGEFQVANITWPEFFDIRSKLK